MRSAVGVQAEGVALDADDEAYRIRQIEVFHSLRELTAGAGDAP
ncbi:MAG: hypothetical protein ACR2H3_04320 [Acidimicrobiales bacterium]